ncbi:MAG: calcium-binding protein [Sedimentitalea sp.]
MSVYNALASTSTSPLFKHLIDLSLTFVNGLGLSAATQTIHQSYTSANTTAFAPTDAALMLFAQSAGYVGANQSSAMSFLLTEAHQNSGPGNGDGVVEFMLSFLTQGTLPLGAINGATLNDLNASGPGFSINGFVISDADAETPDATVVGEAASNGAHLIIIDQVALGTEANFNDPVVIPPTATQGTSGIDTITGDSSDEHYQLLDGNDFMNGKQGNDILEGDGGNDRLRGGQGEDEVYGGADNDRLWGGKGDDIVEGGAGIDTLDGGKDNDIMDGGANNDLVKGGEGNDIVRGGSGADLLHGNKGDDQLFGDAGDDILVDAQGNSTLTGGTGNDFLKGGVGNDTFVFETGGGADRVRDFSQGDDLLDVSDFGLSGIGDMFLSQQGSSARIDFLGGEVVILDDNLALGLNASDFIF